MFTKITDIGKAKLASLTSEQRIQFVKYRIGLLPDNLIVDLHEVEFDINSTFLQSSLTNFDMKYEADDTQILHRIMDASNTVLKVHVPQDFAFFRLNCVVFNATVDAEEFPFIVAYALEINPKFSTVINRYGTRYFFMLHLDLTDRDNKFDFSNLEFEAPDFAQFTNNYTTPIAYKVKQDQVIINNHVNVPDTHGVFAIDSQGTHFGVLMQPWVFTDNYETLQIDGENLQLDGEDVYVGVNSTHGQLILTGT